MWHHHRHYYHGGGDLLTLVAILFIGVLLMPIVGVYKLISGPTDSDRTLGLVLTVIGVVLYIALGIH